MQCGRRNRTFSLAFRGRQQKTFDECRMTLGRPSAQRGEFLGLFSFSEDAATDTDHGAAVFQRQRIVITHTH